MTTKLYHYQLGFPIAVNLPKRLKVRYSQHALRAMKDDRYGLVQLSEVLDLSAAKVIELELDANEAPIKIVIRLPLDAERDACLAIAVQGTLMVKTVWVNLRSDAHKTLNLSRYSKVS
jgi:hypothetical protein